jgi:hypothetical protein
MGAMLALGQTCFVFPAKAGIQIALQKPPVFMEYLLPLLPQNPAAFNDRKILSMPTPVFADNIRRVGQ